MTYKFNVLVPPFDNVGSGGGEGVSEGGTLFEVSGKKGKVAPAFKDATDIAIGASLSGITTGKENTGFGVNATNTVTSGVCNTGVGYEALSSVTTSKYNTAVGAYALNVEKTGEDEFGPGLNTAIGFKALGSMAGVKGAHHTAVGAECAALLKEGRENVFIGSFNLRETQKASGVVSIGVGALEFYKGTEEIFQMTAIGTESCQALEGASHGTTALGYATLKLNKKGEFNTVFGHAVLAEMTGGSNNTFFGFKAGQFIPESKENTGFGYEVLGNIAKNSEQNTLFGYKTFRSSEGNKNTAFGFESGLENITGASNVFLGYQAGKKETGSNKLYISNSETATPLIKGDFSAKTLTLTGTVTGLALAEEALTVTSAAAPKGISFSGSIAELEQTEASVNIGGITAPVAGSPNLVLLRNSNSTETRVDILLHKGAEAPANGEFVFSNAKNIELKAKQSILLWYDSGLKAWVNLNAVPSEGSVNNASVEAGANIALSKVEEGTNLVKLSGEQTITGFKKFTPPTAAEAELGHGAEGTEALEVTAGAGQAVTGKAAENFEGGGGAKVQIVAGTGGKGKNITATGSASGGPGGKFVFKAGTGGSGEMKEAEGNASGGEGGGITVETGGGGAAAGTSGGERLGGGGGTLSIKAGEGGKATSGTGTRTGGVGAAIKIVAGKGGEGTTLGGNGGELFMESGRAGLSGAPSGGPFTLVAGKASTDALSGSIIFKTGKVAEGTERLAVTGDGTVFHKNRTSFKRTAPAEITASEKKYKPGEGTVFLLKAKAGVKIEGIEAPPQEGALYKFINTGTEEIAFTNETAGGEEALILATGAETKIAKNHGIDFWYDGTAKKWRQAGVF